MATASEAQAVKSLNNSEGRRRFVFRSIAQRLDEIEIDVFRSLDKIKAEPSKGSTFFRDCLVEMRELNTAEDFISFHDKMTPIVQNLPLILLHKETIFTELVSRLRISARLSVEPILRLLAALSRDLLEDFIPFFPRIVDSLLSLLQNGADREPEIVDQIFTSWSNIVMYLQKYLIHRLEDMLEVTAKLRYYPKDYVQEYMAQAMGFLLRTRTVTLEQLEKGVKKIMLDVVGESQPIIKDNAISALLYNVMTGTSTRFHSKAKHVLLLLMDQSIIGSAPAVEVIISTLQRLCEDLDSKELSLMFECLYQEIKGCVTNGDVERLNCLLSLLVSTVQVKNGKVVREYQQMLEVFGLLVRTYIIPSDIRMEEEHLSEVVDKSLQLMLCILSGLHSHNDMSTISSCSLQWAPVFDLKKSSLLGFLQKLLQKDIDILNTFRVNILRALNSLIETSQVDVIYLFLTFCERLQLGVQSLTLVDDISRIQAFLHGTASKWLGVLKGVVNGGSSSTSINKADLALLWGVINCFPHIVYSPEGATLLFDLIDAIDQVLMIEDGNVVGFPKYTWQCLIGTCLNSYRKWTCSRKLEDKVTSKFLALGKRHKSCRQVLVAVADFLDPLPEIEGETGMVVKSRISHPELGAEMAMDALEAFADNLCHSNRGIRVSTLGILRHYETLSCSVSTEDEPVLKKIKTEVSPNSHVDNKGINVLQLLFSIEYTPLSVSTSRKVSLLISRIQMDVSAGRIFDAYLPLALNGMIGIFHNRFSSIWKPASECLAVIIRQNIGLVWDRFLNYFWQCQSIFQASFDQVYVAGSNKSRDLVERFDDFVTLTTDSTPSATVLCSLLQCLQKIPTIESKSHQILPLFLKFLGYDCEDIVSVGAFNSNVCRGKEWKMVLNEWLNLLKLMHNLKHLFKHLFLKEVLQNRLLDENDAEIQMKVLDCLLLWKDEFLLPYSQQLKNFANFHNLREELTRWSVSRESNLIKEEHRASIVPVVIRLLIPKVRKVKKQASRKNSRVNHRKAVLGFIAQLDVEELPLFFALLIKPMRIIPMETEGAANSFWTSSNASMEEFQLLNFFEYFTISNITALSWKKRSAFLHVIEDILGVFDASRIGPFLNFIMGCVVRILGSSTLGLNVEKGNGSAVENDCTALASIRNDGDADVLISTCVGQLKDLRSLSLKIVSFVLNKYDDHDFSSEFWDLFFESVKPLIDGFKKEGFSGQKPSCLFSCFSAMSKSKRLVPLLCREQKLVPDILSILAVTSASEATVDSVLKFVKNLLTLDDELGTDDSDVKRVILLHIGALVDNLHCLFESNFASKRKLLKQPGETELNIFKILPKYIDDELLARKFVAILLPVLANGAQTSEFQFVALQVIRDIVPLLGSGITNTILNAVSPLLASSNLDRRVFICDLLKALAKADPSMNFVAELVQKLNATSETELDSLDYDIVLEAYESITVGIFDKLKEDHALVILSHCVYDMSSEESTLRHRAYSSLLSFVQFSALKHAQVAINECEMPGNMLVSDDQCWTRACIQNITSEFLLKHMADAMKKGPSVREEWIDLLREMVLKLPEVANLGSLKPLLDENLEIDFFKNIIHIQKHRRARALKRFKNVVTDNYTPEFQGITMKLFVPFFFTTLMEEEKGEHLKNMCIEVLASVSSKKWSLANKLLMTCFHEISKHPVKQKLLMRLICSILHEFQFSGTTDASSPSKMQTDLQNTVLPKIQKLLSDSEKVDVNLSLAALRVLKLLPGDIMDSQLPSIIHRISNFLKNRLESIRDEARCALADCLKELGLEYLHFIVKVLRSTLKRGFELHVLGYTLNFILSKFLITPISGKLDYCLEDLLYIAQNDILGDVAEEKDVEKIASKMKETKKQKSFETLKLIAQSVTFKSHALKLLSPVISHFVKHLTPKTKTKLESMLSYIAAGIECNPTVDQSDLFIFVHGLIEDGIKDENDKGGSESSIITRKNGRGQNVGKVDSSGRIVGSKSVCSHLFSVFALGILQKRIKNLKVRKGDEQIESMLDPFVILLVKCLNSKYEDVLSATLRSLTSLVRLDLPSIESQADNIKAVIFGIAHSWVNSGSSLMESCLRLLTVLLRDSEFTLSNDHLHLLIQLPVFVDIERDPSVVALSLLKAIVKRKLQVPEIYDLVTKVAELMVTSQVESIRHKCSQILLRFLNDYRLSKKRFQQHLDFLLSNLRYEHSSGRITVLEMLHAVIKKNPENVVDAQSQMFFVHLVVCLANDQDNDVRKMAGEAIKLLTSRVSQSSLNSILEYSVAWYLGEKQQLWGAAAQVLGLLAEVEVMKEKFLKKRDSVLQVTKCILQSAIDAVTGRQPDFPSETVPFWKEAFYSLVLLEKMLNHDHDLCFDRVLEVIWEAICELLLHPHMWLRCIASRLVAFYFAAVKKACSGNDESLFGSYYLIKPDKLFMIAVHLSCQLKTQLVDDAANKLFTQNIAFTVCGVHSLMGQLECADPRQFWSTLEQHEQGRILEALELLGARKGKNILLSLTSDVCEKNDESPSNDIRCLLVSNLLKKLGNTALQMEDIQMKIVFDSFGKISSEMSQTDCLLYAYEMLLPLYKVCEGFSGTTISENMKQSAQEVLRCIQSKLGSQNFAKIYNEIRKKLKAKRDKRKQEQKQLAVVNPMQNAKRKLRIAQKHRANKRRKIMKMGRWTR